MNNAKKILKTLTGITFKVIGPFLVGSCNAQQFNLIPVSQHGHEEIVYGQSTKSHQHSFLSIYKASDLNLISGKETYVLPKKAIVFVPEKVHHSWIPKDKGGSVGSLDNRHRKQVIL